MNSKTKLILIIILGLLFIFPLGVRSYADENSDIEEWAESEDVLLDKVRYETKTRKLTVELTQTKQEIAHEYELYLMIEGDLDNAIGRYLSLGKILSILGIMTVDVNDRVKVYLTGSGKIIISDQELYFGENETVTSGTKVLIGVEAFDENYTPSKSNLIELTVGDDVAEAEAINAVEDNNNNGFIQDDDNNPSDNQNSNAGVSPLLIGGGIIILIGAVTTVIILGKKKNTNKGIPADIEKTQKNTKESGDGEDDKQLPSLEDKTVYVLSEDEELIKVLKSKHYLEVIEPDDEEESEEPVDRDAEAADNKAHLYVADVNDEDRLKELLEKKKDVLEKIPLGLVLEKSLLNKCKDRLEQLKKDRLISGYVPFGADKNDIMIRLILPILKPDLKSDASLENIGLICDLLGIEGISEVISAYISGRDIKTTIEDGDLGFTGTASIISNVASIMGMDTLASVSGLVGDIDDIKTAGEEGTGAYEKKNAILGAKDIVDVVKDLTDKS